MKSFLLTCFLLIISSEICSEIIYIEPVRDAKYVSINNNIIIGFDETISGSDLSSKIKVKGTLSGDIKGEVILTQDNKKIIFQPHQAFKFNEQVEVKLRKIKTVSGSVRNLKYTFKTQAVKPEWDHRKSMTEELGFAPEYKFNGQSDSHNIPTLTVNISNNPSPGDLYLSNFPFGNIPNTPHLLIADNTGSVLYSREVYIWALDYKKQPNGIVTYFEGLRFVGEDAHHNMVDSYQCGNGYVTDHHELQLLDNGHALLMSYDPQTVDMSQIVLRR